MNIIIPSRGRATSVRVLEFLPQQPRQRLFLVVPENEKHAYEQAMTRKDVEVVGRDFDHIGQKRQWILDEWGDEPLVMMDDDLRFRARTRDGAFKNAGPIEVAAMLNDIREYLRFYLHAGIADEFMCQHNPSPTKLSGRYNQVLAYDFSKILKNERPRFRLAVNEEHDVHLQLLSRGLGPIILTDYTKGSKYNASGGCSTWRTPEFELAQFRAFEKLWPGVVSLRPNRKSLCGWSTTVAWRKVCP